MSRMLRLVLFVLGGLVVLLLVMLLAIYVAARHEPEFYRKALETKRDVLEKGSDRMLRKVAALESAMVKPGHWEIRFTADEINGWLAVDMAKNHPSALPPSLKNPRVAIGPKELSAACRFEQGDAVSVLSLTIQAYMSEPNVVALRIVRARAGLLPLPLGRVLEGLSQAARDMRFRLEWRRTGGDPVALLAPADDGDARWIVRIETVRLDEGEIYVAGTTKRAKR